MTIYLTINIDPFEPSHLDGFKKKLIEWISNGVCKCVLECWIELAHQMPYFYPVAVVWSACQDLH